jgi:hypothetical protein
MFSMEMGWRAVFRRMASIEARVDLPAFHDQQRPKRENPDDCLHHSRAPGELCGWKLLVSAKAAKTPMWSSPAKQTAAATSNRYPGFMPEWAQLELN